MKNILFIIPSLGGGGAEKVLVDILNRFDYNNYNVDLLVIHLYGPYVNQINNNVKVHSLFKGAETIVSRIISKVEKALSVFDLINKEKVRSVIKCSYDTIISFTTNEALYFHSFLFDKAEKNINWVHVDVLKNHNNYPFKSKEAEVDAYQQIDQLVFVSNDARVAFNTVFNDLRAPQNVIYNLIDREAIEKKSNDDIISNAIHTIIAIGRLIPVKGYDRLIKVAKKLKDDGISFQCQLIGAGILQGELEGLIAQEGVGDVVKMLGFKSNPYPYLKAADIFISTSLSEAFPLVVCESLCLGKAIVCTKTTGPIEMLQDKYGILTEHDIDDIYTKLRSLLVSPDMIKKYQALALERSSMFDPQKTMLQIYNVL